MTSEAEAKKKIDDLIKNARIKCFRPIRIAEILYHSRTEGGLDLANWEDYRVNSERWRDEVTQRLMGVSSKSSRSYTRDITNLMPAESVSKLDEVNRQKPGLVENYIYRKLREDKWGGIISANDYVQEKEASEFSLHEFMSHAVGGGLGSGALYEICTYALFSSIVDALGAKVSLWLENPDPEILEDFEKFISITLGVDKETYSFETPAELYRTGKGTYASDKEVDIRTNFGSAIQVKHVSLDKREVSSIEESVYASRIVIVCKDAEKDAIKSVTEQLGFEKVKGIITYNDISEWYELALQKHEEKIGKSLLQSIGEEFERFEFTIPQIDEFIGERGYKREQLRGLWRVTSQLQVSAWESD